MLTVRSCDPHHFALQDVELLTSVANFLAAAIENARIRSDMEVRIAELSAEVEQLAIVRERERIGREMHDGLAQTLGLLNVQIEVVKGAAEEGDWVGAEQELALLDSYLGHAYSEVRQALDDLRHAKPKGEAFIPYLDDALREFGRQNSLEAVLVTENGSGPICLPPLVEVHLHRVIQEALANIRRHAAARRVEVRVSKKGDGLDVIVADDGVGFDLEKAQVEDSAGYGLQTMKERVEGLGGRFAVDSQVGSGTRVTMFVPCG